MIGFAKRVLVSYLATSEDPRLRNLAGWIKDAEQKAVDTVLAIITDGVKNEGRISSATVERVLGVSTQSPNPSGPAASPAARPPGTLLEQYLEIIRLVMSFGYLGKAIYLQGFLHSNKCSSLWLFEEKETPEVSIGKITGPEEILYRHFDILIGKQIDDAEFRSQNRQIGNNYTTWLDKVDRGSMQEVSGLFEDRIELKMTQVEPRKHGKPKISTVTETVPFGDRVSGVESMAESLPIAVEERAVALTNVGRVWDR